MSNENNSFFQNVFGNRFLKYLVPYVIGAWTSIQVAAFLEERYSWAQGWPDFILLLGLSFLPSVFFFSYQRTGAYADHLSKSEKVFYPINLIIALGLAFLGQNMAKADKIGTQVAVLNEEGAKIERFVPSTTLVKRVVLLPWENKDDNPDIQWMTFGLPEILNSDLEQDIRLTAQSPVSVADGYKEYDANLYEVPPFAIQRKIALDEYSDYFMTGSIQKQNKTFQVSTTLTSTEDGKKIYTKTYENVDPYSIIDQITEDFRKEIYIENELPDDFIDLPVSNLYTSDLDALKAYTECLRELQFNNNIKKAITFGEESIRLDPKFAIAYSMLGYTYLQNNQGVLGKEMISKSMQHKEALSERMQFLIKYYDFSIAKDQPKKAIKLLEMWSQLYPMDYIPYSFLINWYSRVNDLSSAKETAIRALEKGHTGKLLLLLAKFENQSGNYEQAEAYYDRFTREFPHKSKDITGLGNTYLAQGDFDKAQEHFERMNLLEPTNTNVLRKLADIQGKMGNYDEQLALYQEALIHEKQLMDSIAILQEIEAVYIEKGQINKFLDLIDLRWELSKHALPAYMEGLNKVNSLVIIAMLDQKGRQNILPDLMEHARSVDPSLGDIECMVKCNYYLFAEDKKSLKPTLEECASEIEKFQTDIQDAIINAYAEKVYGNYDKALAEILKAVEKSNVKITDFSIVGKLYILLEKYDEAIAQYEAILQIDPTSPKVFLALAKIYQATGDAAKSKENAEKALEIWKDADANYIPALEAQEILTSLQ